MRSQPTSKRLWREDAAPAVGYSALGVSERSDSDDENLGWTSAEALIALTKVHNDNSKRPRPQADIDDLSMQIVIDCAVCLFTSFVPLLVLVPCLFVLGQFNCRGHGSWHVFVIGLRMYCVIFDQFDDVVKYLWLRDETDIPMREIARFRIANVLRTLLSVAGIVVGLLLTRRSTEAHADAAYYKARFMETLRKEESVVLWDESIAKDFDKDKVDWVKFNRMNRVAGAERDKDFKITPDGESKRKDSDFPVAIPIVSPDVPRNNAELRALGLLDVYNKYFNWLFEGLRMENEGRREFNWLFQLVVRMKGEEEKTTLVDKEVFNCFFFINLFMFFTMVPGMGIVMYNNVRFTYRVMDIDTKSLFGVLVALYITCSEFIRALLVTLWWFNLLGTLQYAAVQVRKNSHQLLLFASFVDKDVRIWTKANKDSLVKIWTKMTDNLEDSQLHDLKEKVNQETINLTHCKGTYTDLDKFVTFDIQLKSINECIKTWEDYELQLDLRKDEDIRVWWTLRQFLQVDFMDESAIMDYCCSCALLLVLALSLVIFACLLINKGQDFGSLQDLRHLTGGGVMVVGVGQIIVLMYTFYVMMEACVLMNSTLEQDSSILLDTAVKVRLQADFKDQDNDKAAKDNYHDKAAIEATANLLTSLHEKIIRYDQQQKLLGFPITKKLRNGIYSSVGVMILNYALSSMAADLTSKLEENG